LSPSCCKKKKRFIIQIHIRCSNIPFLLKSDIACSTTGRSKSRQTGQRLLRPQEQKEGGEQRKGLRFGVALVQMEKVFKKANWKLGCVFGPFLFCYILFLLFFFLFPFFLIYLIASTTHYHRLSFLFNHYTNFTSSHFV
jgi:hypothetical protein